MAGFDDLLNDPSFQMGMSLLGGARTANPILTAQTAMMAWQKMQQAADEAKSKKLLQAQQAAEQAALAKQHGVQTEHGQYVNQMLLQSMRDNGINVPDSALPQQPAPMPQPPQAQAPDPNVNPFNGMPRLGPNLQETAAQPQPVQRYPGTSAQPLQPGASNMQQVMASNDAAPTQNGRYQPVPKEAQMWALAGQPELAKLYMEGLKDQTLPNGARVRVNRDTGALELAPHSLDILKLVETMQQAVQAGFKQVEVPVGGLKLQMSGTQAARFFETGELPPQYQKFQQQAPQPAGGAQPASVGNNNFGNLRPAGATKGFQVFSTPEEGLAAIPKQLSIYGQRGINTLAKVISTWSPPNENDTPALIAAAAKVTGLDPNKPLDMSNPVTQHLLTTAIIKQEGNAKQVYAQPQQTASPQGNAPIPGVTPSAAESAQSVEIGTSFGKKFIAAQDAGQQARGKELNMRMIQNLLDKVPFQGLQGPPTEAMYKAFAAAGAPIPKSASIADALIPMTKQLALTMRSTADGGGLPGQMSNYEDRLLQSMMPQLEKLPLANKIISTAYIAQQQRVQKIAKLWRSYPQGQVTQDIYDKIDQLNEQSDRELETKINTLTGTDKIEKYVSNYVNKAGQSQPSPQDTGNRPLSNPLDKYMSH